MKKLTLLITILLTSITYAQVPSYVPTNGLVDWLPFNGNAIDESGNGNNGTVNGATLTNDRYGVANKAYSFDGVNDYISINDNQSLDVSNVTISAWFNATDYGAALQQFQGHIVSKRESSGLGTSFQMALENSTPNHTIWATYTIASNGWAFYSSNSVLTTQNWIHVTYTHDNFNAKIFINGNLVNVTSVYGGLQNNNLPLWIGARPNAGGNSSFFHGKLDDIGIWNRALTDCEVLKLYSNSTLNGGADITVCQGLPVTLSASGGSNYSWNNNINNGQSFIPTTQTPFTQTTQSYIVSETINGCVFSDTVLLTLLPSIGITTQPIATQTVCTNGSVSPLSVTHTGGTGLLLYQWYSNSSPTNFGATAIIGANSSVYSPPSNVNGTTYFYCVISDQNGCSTTSTSSCLNVLPLAILMPNSDLTVCCQSTIPQINFIGNGPTYNWTVSNNSNVNGYNLNGTNNVNSMQLNNITSVVQTITYYVTSQFSSCNTVSDTFSITVLPCQDSIQANNILNQTICNGTTNPSIQITGNASNFSWINTNSTIGLGSFGGSNVIPSFVGNNPTLSPITSNVVISPVYTYNGLSCNGTNQSFTITVYPTPPIIAGNDATICLGESVSLTASGAATYSWNNNIINSQPFSPSITQEYIVSGTDSMGCVGSDTVQITVLNTTSSSQTQTALDSYTWPVNSQIYTQSGTYSDTLVNAAGCDSIVTLNLMLNYTGINENNSSSLVISPNPTNGDFSLNGLELYNNIKSILVSDVNGKLVKELDPSASKFNLETVKSGVYFLTITAGDKQEVIKIIKE
jgi:hypothetical protein